MVRTLLTLAAGLVRRRVPIFELAGAAAVVAGLAQWTPSAGWVAAGVALLAKSLEWESKAGDG